jgi:hypothetical protein
MALIPLAEPITGDSDRGVRVQRPTFVARAPLEFKFTAAGVNVSVPHTLGRVPEHWITVGLTAGITIYNGSAPSTEDVLVLRSTGAGTAFVLPL